MAAFDFSNPLVLEDAVALLLPLEAAHEKVMANIAMDAPEVWIYTLMGADTPEGLRRYIEYALAQRDKRDAYPFAVWDKRSGQCAGSTRYYHMDLRHGVTNIGYTWYHPSYWGTGLNLHCKHLLLTHAFEVMGMDRVEFRADVLNTRSIAALRKLGAREEGVLRSHYKLPSGRRRDSLILSILQTEWHAGVRQALQNQLNVS